MKQKLIEYLTDRSVVSKLWVAALFACLLVAEANAQSSFVANGDTVSINATKEVYITSAGEKDITIVNNTASTGKGIKIAASGGGITAVGNSALPFNSNLTTTGSASVGSATAATGQLDVTAASASTIGQRILLAASQTADAFRVLNSSGTRLFHIDSTGSIFMSGSTAYANFRDGGTTKAIVGVSTSVDTPIVGMTAGDLGIRVNANDLCISTNSGASCSLTQTAAGNTVASGTLSSTGDFAVNTNKFNVAAASGNTTVAGTLAVTGASTLTGAIGFTGGGAIQGTGSLQLQIASGSGMTLRNGELTLDTSNFQIVPGSSTVAIRNSGDTVNEFLFSAGGGFSNIGTITSSRTTDLGWTVVNAANQACNTTCTSACVIGLDAGASAFLACTDATADSCLCAGAS